MNMAIVARDENQIAEVPARHSSGLALSFGEMTTRVAQLDQFYREVMQDGTDYGKIPGTDKPTLYQPGAQMLDQIFGLTPTFEILPSSVIDWNRPIPFFHYVIRCRLVSRRSGEVVAEGIGSANSHEDRYRWRQSKRKCPSCNAEAIIKGQQKFGGGWVCFKKVNGCGAKFADGDQSIEGQPAGRVENEDTASLENTLCKMAQKRAHVAGSLNATGAARIFTQDIEDLPQFQNALVVESSSRATGDEPRSDPADAKPTAEVRAKFDQQWARGVAKAVQIGAVAPDKPGTDATVGALRKAQAELVDVVTTRQKLVDEMIAKTTAVRALGADVNDVDPAQVTDQEVHEILATLDKMLAAAPASSADDLDDSPF